MIEFIIYESAKSQMLLYTIYIYVGGKCSQKGVFRDSVNIMSNGSINKKMLLNSLLIIISLQLFQIHILLSVN